MSSVANEEDEIPADEFSDSQDELASLLGEHGIEIAALSEEEMRPYAADVFYRRLSRRELRDLLWATQSSETCPFAVLIVLAESNSSLGETHGQITQTFIARMDSDLAEFCDGVAESVATQMPTKEDFEQVLPQKRPVEHKMTEDGRDSQGSTEDDEEPSAIQMAEDPRVHLIFSDHPYCLWKPCLNVLESLLRMQGKRVTQHRFSGVWTKRVELIPV